MPDIPTYRCRRLDRKAAAPTADIDQAPWSETEWIEDFVLVGGPEPPPDRFLSAAARWDDEGLYVAYKSAPSLVPVTKTQRDDDLFNECTVEIFMAAGKGFYEIEVNPLGAVLDLHCPDEREEQYWRPQAQWHAEGMRWAVRGMRSPEVRADEAWMAELSVPWAAMPEVTREPFEGAESLRVNLCRCQMRPDGTGELTSWTAATKRFSELDVMGRLLLVE
ncbi:MAG: carbohydrate-binding family 9-like protein [Candidatus Latescibacterota bacterium]|nr:carbohydrate-binding family 9-like protein [Candidatus Latescibacterota bacterium]